MKIYADNAATTRVSDTALAAMDALLSGDLRQSFQPSYAGTSGRRKKLAGRRAILHGTCMRIPGEITFTSGGSEADNQALRTRRPWGRSGANVISSQRNSSTMPCSIPSRPWSGRL